MNANNTFFTSVHARKFAEATFGLAKLRRSYYNINYSHFKSRYGTLRAPVADCNDIQFDSHCKQDMTISDYMNYMESDEREQLLYLKDWHLKRARPDDYYYEIPIIFASDWLNEYAQDKKEDDFMFVYIGPKTSWTPLHADVYSSYSWSVNVVGKKKWIIFPPGEEEKLRNSLGNLPMYFNSEMYDGIKYYTVYQDAGDAIFVPTGWYHQVVNEMDTISVNHNWINGCNIQHVWEALSRTLISVEHEIGEFRHSDEFQEQCQLILRSLFGMDFASFANLLCHIGQKRLSQLQDGDNNIGLGEFHLGTNQIKFDLKQVLKILSICVNHPIYVNNKYITSNIQYDFLNITNSIKVALK